MPTRVVVPITASFTANGTADLNQVQQESLDPFTANYDLFVSNASANDVFKAFSIADGDVDASSDIVVSVVAINEGIVKDALKYALEHATDVSGSSLLKTLMEAYVKTEVENDLSTTGLYNILEAESLLNVDISNSVIGTNGANAMWTELAEEVASKSNAMLNCIATQLPYDNYVDISNGGNLDSAFGIGDSIVFHFTINTALDVTPVNEDVTGAITGGTLTSAGAFAESIFTSATKTRTLNLHITKA
jgi:hypothetical protein